MYYAMMENGKAVRATLDPGASRGKVGEYEYRADWKTFERAAEIAAQLTEATGERWIATDAGPPSARRCRARSTATRTRAARSSRSQRR